MAPLVAAREPAVAFLVLLAPPGVPGEQILYRQAELILRAGGAGEEAVRANRRIQEALFAAVRDAEDPAAAEAAALAALRRQAGAVPDAGSEQLAALEAQAAQVAAPWFRFFLRHDPAAVLAKVPCPVLALWGEKDLQVPPDQSRSPLEAALAAAGNRRLTARVLPGLNHLLQTAETGHPTEYGRIEETMAPAALELIAGWIRDTAAGPTDRPGGGGG